MTAPTRTLMPARQYDAVAANPQTGGLYTAATIEPTEDERLDGGVEVTPVNEASSGHGYWDTGCGPQDDPDAEKSGERAARVYAPSLIVWAADDCSLIANSSEEARARAAQLLRLYEPLDVEAATATRLLADAGAAATAPTATFTPAFVAAVGAVEAALGRTGVPGVIHASRSLAATAAHYGLIVSGPGGRMNTPLGNAWAFGGGYDALGTTLVGTGPVTVRRSSITARDAVEHRQNQRTAVAERTINVSWELTTVAQQIA